MRASARWVVACAVGAALASAGTGVAGAATQIGGTFNVAPAPDCNGGFLIADTSYVVPGSGSITSFSFQATLLSPFGTAGDQPAFLVLRPTGGSGYTVVGSTGVVTIQTNNDLETFTPPAPIAVEAGDILGEWTGATGLTSCASWGTAPGSLKFAFASGQPAVGNSVDIPIDGDPDYDHLNLSAQFEPAGSADPCASPTQSGAGFIMGTPGDDVIAGSAGADTIDGGGGNDIICAGGGDDRVVGGAGDDRLFGEGGADRLFGGSGTGDSAGGDDYLDGGGRQRPAVR